MKYVDSVINREVIRSKSEDQQNLVHNKEEI